MPDDDFTRAQRDWLDRWLNDRMDNVGMGMEGEARQDTQRGFYWLNDRRKAWDTPDEQADRAWVRKGRESAGKKNEGVRQLVISVGSAVGGALLLLLLARLGVK